MRNLHYRTEWIYFVHRTEKIQLTINRPSTPILQRPKHKTTYALVTVQYLAYADRCVVAGTPEAGLGDLTAEII